MSELTKLFQTPVQLAYVVADAEAAAAQWVNTVGAGPFFLRRHIQVSDVVYRGVPATFDHTSAYGQWGNTMVELVQNHTVGASVLTERTTTATQAQPSGEGVVPKGRAHVQGLPRIHHVACLVDDFAAALQTAVAAGIEVAMSARTRSTPFSFLDTVDTLGHFIEVYPRTASVTEFYALVAEAAANWTGANPVRLLD
jgi:hypothetical protein